MLLTPQAYIARMADADALLEAAFHAPKQGTSIITANEVQKEVTVVDGMSQRFAEVDKRDTDRDQRRERSSKYA